MKVEVKEEYFTDDMATMVGLQKKLEGELRSVIGLGFKVKLVEPKASEPLVLGHTKPMTSVIFTAKWAAFST